mmetsp:Transcript_42336/g.52096  ORF Transcript_42336/g.52096 Transcript_42336/m.52096 type:complete len:264 (+) Transcript_42336:454-1245(+)
MALQLIGQVNDFTVAQFKCFLNESTTGSISGQAPHLSFEALNACSWVLTQLFTNFIDAHHMGNVHGHSGISSALGSTLPAKTSGCTCAHAPFSDVAPIWGLCAARGCQSATTGIEGALHHHLLSLLSLNISGCWEPRSVASRWHLGHLTREGSLKLWDLWLWLLWLLWLWLLWLLWLWLCPPNIALPSRVSDTPRKPSERPLRWIGAMLWDQVNHRLRPCLHLVHPGHFRCERHRGLASFNKTKSDEHTLFESAGAFEPNLSR